MILTSESVFLFFASKVVDWNRDLFGNIFYRKKRLAARILGTQESIGVQTLFLSVRS